MNRTSSTIAIIISLKPAGENNFTVTLLTEDKGIIYAMLYGGPKSRLRSLVSQWNTGRIWLYENTEKNQIKISDFEVLNYHTSFSQNLFKFYAASLASEIIIKTHCLGNSKDCFKLINGFLDGMELCNEEQSRLGLLRFLWRLLKISGMEPETNNCYECNKSFLDSEIEIKNESYYNLIENNFICLDCLSNKGYTKEAVKQTYIPINNSVIHYLNGISILSPQEARQLKINKEDFYQLKGYIYFVIEKLLELKLNTLEIGMGIL